MFRSWCDAIISVFGRSKHNGKRQNVRVCLSVSVCMQEYMYLCIGAHTHKNKHIKGIFHYVILSSKQKYGIVLDSQLPPLKDLKKIWHWVMLCSHVLDQCHFPDVLFQQTYHNFLSLAFPNQSNIYLFLMVTKNIKKARKGQITNSYKNAEVHLLLRTRLPHHHFLKTVSSLTPTICEKVFPLLLQNEVLFTTHWRQRWDPSYHCLQP